MRGWVGIGFNLADKSKVPDLRCTPLGIIDILIPETNVDAGKDLAAFVNKKRNYTLTVPHLELGRQTSTWLEIFFYQGLNQCLWDLTGFDINQAPVQVGHNVVRLIKEGCTLSKLTARIAEAELLLSDLLQNNLDVFNLIATAYATTNGK